MFSLVVFLLAEAWTAVSALDHLSELALELQRSYWSRPRSNTANYIRFSITWYYKNCDSCPL